MSIVEILIVSLALSMDAFAVTISNLLAYPNLSRARRLAMPITFGVFQGVMLLVGFLVGFMAIGFIEAYAGPVALVILFVIGGRMIFEAVRDMRKKKSEIEESKEAAPVIEETEEVSEEAAEVLEASEAAEASEVLEVLEESGVALEASQDSESSEILETSKALEVPKNSADLSLLTIIAQGVATSLDALIVGVSLAALTANIYIAAPTVGVTTFVICLLGLVIGKRLGVLLGGRAQFIGGIILILIGIRICFF